MNDDKKDPFHIPPHVEEMLREEARKIRESGVHQFSREEVIAMMERGEDVSKATNGQWSLLRSFNKNLKYGS